MQESKISGVGRARRLLALTVGLMLMASGTLASSGVAAAQTRGRLVWDVPGSRLVLPNGWSLLTTSTPLIRVEDQHGRIIGNIELGNYVLEQDLARARSSDELHEALALRAERFHETMRQDRGSLGHHWVAGGTDPNWWGTSQGIKYRATVLDRHGKVTERILGFMTVHRGQLWTLAVNGVGKGNPSDGEDLLSTRQQHILRGYMRQVLDSSPLPKAGTAIASGMIAGTEGGMDGGRLWLVWNGKKQRIYQPGGMTRDEADRYRQGIRTAQVRVHANRTGSVFKVVPPSGRDARLHLLIGNTLHEVVVQHVKPSVIDRLPAHEPLLLDKLKVPTG